MKDEVFKPFSENLSVLVRLLTPIIPHTTEEVYSHMQEAEESVYLTIFQFQGVLLIAMPLLINMKLLKIYVMMS